MRVHVVAHMLSNDSAGDILLYSVHERMDDAHRGRLPLVAEQRSAGPRCNEAIARDTRERKLQRVLRVDILCSTAQGQKC